jgi:hypothetical protein
VNSDLVADTHRARPAHSRLVHFGSPAPGVPGSRREGGDQPLRSARAEADSGAALPLDKKGVGRG